MGYLLVDNIKPINKLSNIIRWHHRNWEHGIGFKNIDAKTGLISQIIYLADRLSILIANENKNVLTQSNEILAIINEDKGKKFNPKLVAILMKISLSTAFWLNIVTVNKEPIIKHVLGFKNKYLSHQELVEFCWIFIYSIDFRSSYTASHSVGVARVAEKLAQLSKLPDDDCKLMLIAEYFHDIGKLIVPIEILEKTGKLTEDEYNIIKQHTYYTYFFLDSISGLEAIRNIATYHHESIDGNGYPFRIASDELSYKSRLLCIADIFTALTEKRPYRNPMDKKEVAEILLDMADKNKIDKDIANLTIQNFDILCEYNKEYQKIANENFVYIEKKFLEISAVSDSN